MKVVCNREQLLKTFSAAASVASAKSPKEVLTNVKMVADTGRVCLQATDMETWISVEAQGCEAHNIGNALLPVGRAGLFLREAPDETVTIETVGNEVELRTAGGMIKLPSADPKEFPSRESRIEGKHHILSAKFLLEAIKRTVFAIDPDSSRYALGGILFVLDDSEAVVVGTDGRRLACVKGEGQSVDGHATENQAIVPAKAAQVIRRTLGDSGDVKIAFTLNDVTIEGAGVTINSRLVEGRYPNWKQVIPKVDQWTVDTAIPAGPFDSVVRQAAITADVETRGLEFRLKDGSLSASASSASSGRSKISMPVGHAGEEVAVKLDYRYVRDFLSTLDPSELFELQLQDAHHAVLLSTVGYQYVVMPMALEH